MPARGVKAGAAPARRGDRASATRRGRPGRPGQPGVQRRRPGLSPDWSCAGRRGAAVSIPHSSGEPQPRRETHPGPRAASSRCLPQRPRRRGRRNPGIPAKPSPRPFALFPGRRVPGSGRPRRSGAGGRADWPGSAPARGEPRPGPAPPAPPTWTPPGVSAPSRGLLLHRARPARGPAPDRPPQPGPAPRLLVFRAVTASTARLGKAPPPLPRPQRPGPAPSRLARFLSERVLPQLRGLTAREPGAGAESAYPPRCWYQAGVGKGKQRVGKLWMQTWLALAWARSFFSGGISIQLAFPSVLLWMSNSTV